MKVIPGYEMACTDKKLRNWARVGVQTGGHNYLYVCEQLRFIFDVIEEIPDEILRFKILELLIDAFIMGKKLQDRLRYFKKKYNDTTGKQGSSIRHLLLTKKRRRLRRLRKIL